MNASISLDKARATPWPFGAHHGEPMGVLSDARHLSLKDLAYAVESARDELVRRSAAAVLLTRLDQEIEEPTPAAGPLNVVRAKRRSYAQRQQLWLATLEGLIGGGVLGIGVMLFINSLHRRGPAGPTPLTMADVLASPDMTIALLVVIVGMLAIALLATIGLNWLMNRLDRQMEAFRKGEEGEDAVTEEARRALDGNWTLFRNVTLPGRRADIDIVLVGPPGVWAIEVKTRRGTYRNVGSSWQYENGSRWIQMKKSPGRQARDGAIALKNFLRADGINTYISEAVAWAEPEGRVSLDNPTVPVWTMDRLVDELGNLGNGRCLSDGERERIMEKLTRLSQVRKKGAW